MSGSGDTTVVVDPTIAYKFEPAIDTFAEETKLFREFKYPEELKGNWGSNILEDCFVNRGLAFVCEFSRCPVIEGLKDPGNVIT